MTTTLDPAFAGYLMTNREFLTPTVERAVDELQLEPGARVLDAGTGAGGGLVALAHAVGDAGSVLGVDLHPGVLELAQEHAHRSGVAQNVELRGTDVRMVLSECAAAQASFDAIWASDLVWPGNFADPAGLVRLMAEGLASEGILALFYSNYYQSMFIPGHSRLERGLRAASELRWGLRGEGPDHYDRHVAWLCAAGLNDVRLRVIPRVAFPITADPSARAYLETAVWPELLGSAESHGPQAGLSPADIAEARDLLTPGGPNYLLDDPGYYMVHPTLLATGRR